MESELLGAWLRRSSNLLSHVQNTYARCAAPQAHGASVG